MPNNFTAPIDLDWPPKLASNLTEPIDLDWPPRSSNNFTAPIDIDFHPDELAKMKKETNSGPIDSFSSGWMSGIGQQGQRNAWDQYSNFVNARPAAVKREAGLRDIEALDVYPDSLDYHKPETVVVDNLSDGRATMQTFQVFITMPENQNRLCQKLNEIHGQKKQVQ